jgi:hypothetical protein
MSYFTYFDFTYNNDKKEVVTINMPQNLGKQLFNIATAYTYSINNSKKLIFENIDNNKKRTYWKTLYSNNLNIIDNDKYSTISFKLIENNNFTMHNANSDNIYLKGDYYSFSYLKSKNNTTRNFLRHLVYSNEKYMYCAYELYNNIKKYFEKINNNECQDNDMCSLHIKVNNNMNIDYYNEALNKIDQKNIVVFSNNIEWCKNNKDKFNFNNFNLYFIDINIIEVEFILLSMFKDNIISNSNFSLMASYISYYDTKKNIIAPKTIETHDDVTYII